MRLIDADDLMKKREWFSCYNPECDEIECEFPYISEEDLENAPTVDAVALPPVKIGDTAFFIVEGNIYETEVCVLQWYKHARGVVDEIRGNTIGGSVGASLSEWGKTVFLTREEAEAALAERMTNRGDQKD